MQFATPRVRTLECGESFKVDAGEEEPAAAAEEEPTPDAAPEEEEPPAAPDATEDANADGPPGDYLHRSCPYAGLSPYVGQLADTMAEDVWLDPCLLHR